MKYGSRQVRAVQRMPSPPRGGGAIFHRPAVRPHFPG